MVNCDRLCLHYTVNYITACNATHSVTAAPLQKTAYASQNNDNVSHTSSQVAYVEFVNDTMIDNVHGPWNKKATTLSTVYYAR